MWETPLNNDIVTSVLQEQQDTEVDEDDHENIDPIPNIVDKIPSSSEAMQCLIKL